jgi:hypothetical protein
MSASFTVCRPKWWQNDMLQSYRCFVVAAELLAFPAGVGSMVANQYVPLTAAKLHGTISSRFGRLLPPPSLETQRARVAEYERVCLLEGLDDAALLDEADRRRDTLILSADELGRVRIEPPPGWFGWVRGFDCIALMQTGNRQLGTMALGSPKDARVAGQELSRLLGDRLVVNLSWGSAKKQKTSG